MTRIVHTVSLLCGDHYIVLSIKSLVVLTSYGGSHHWPLRLPTVSNHKGASMEVVGGNLRKQAWRLGAGDQP